MEDQDTSDKQIIDPEDQDFSDEERDIQNLQTPSQVAITEQQRILLEQRQLSSIASFGQIMQQNNFLSSNQQDFFSEKGDSIQSFKYKSNTTVDKPSEMPSEVPKEGTEEVKSMQLMVPGPKSQRTSRVNSQGFNEVGMAYIAAANGLQSTLKNEKFNSQGSDAMIQDIDKNPQGYFTTSGSQSIPKICIAGQRNSAVQGYNPDSPQKQKANYLGEKIRLSHQQLQLQQTNSQIAQDVQEKLQSNKKTFKSTLGGHHQNSGSVAADFGQLVSNSFDRQNIQFQINKDQKQRAKSSTRVKHLDQSNNNSNHDSASNLHSHFFNPSLDLNSPKDMPEKIPLVNNQSAGGAESSLFAPVIQKQHITYHKNAFTNRNEKSNQMKFQNLMKIQQINMAKINSAQPHSNLQQALILSAHSKNSLPQKNTLRSQNSGGTNRGDQKSPNTSDVIDPYAYFNMHQNIQMNSSQPLGFKSCRPTLYNKQQMIISQRNQPTLKPSEIKQSLNKVKFENTNESLKIDNLQSQKTQSPGTSFVDKKIMSGVVGQRAKVVKTSGKGSSNFNSSATTTPAAPIQKLSEVKDPQKFMTFQFVNRKIMQIPEIVNFKNLQELDLSGNLLQEKVGELGYLNFLKRLNLSNNQIQELWQLPSTIEILNLSYNLLKYLPEKVSTKLKNITTIDISNNKLQNLENFNNMPRMKRLLAKNNFVRQLEPIGDVSNLFELDLEGNAIDSHIDFLKFIKNKNDLIVVNLAMNPLMVEVQTIEKFNEDLIGKAPDNITQKTPDEIEELKLLFNCSAQQVSEEPNGDETNRLMGFHLIEELQSCLTFLKNGVLYRNRRVFNKIKQFQLKSKRSVSNNSNSSQPTSGPKFSPMMSKKSQRYEDIEAAYDFIVEQEELKRLKQKKVLAKKRKQRKKQMISQIDDLEGRQLSDENSEGNSSDFSDDDMDYEEFSENLNLELRDDLDESGSCMIDQDSSRIFQDNQQLNDDGEMSQTINSDQEADLLSYKQHGEYQAALDDHDYLNGSTAGFCKKLREINREINQEQQQQLEMIQKIKEQKKMQIQSAKKEKIDLIDIDNLKKTKVKVKQKFDLNLSKITNVPPPKPQPKKKKLIINDEPIMNELIQKKQTKTVQNSHESSQHSGQNNLKKVDQNHQMGVTTIINSKDEPISKDYSGPNGKNLNQSFSLRNMPAGDPHEVESLMMNKQIKQGTNEQASLYIMIDSKPRLIQESQSQQLKKPDELESSFDDSMAQSITTNKKHPNFKLDLSKCKNDDEAFREDFDFKEFNDEGFTATQDNAIDYKALDQNDETLDLDQIILLDPVNEKAVMPSNQKLFSPKNMVVSPDKKDLEKIQKKNVIKNNVTVRDPTPALTKTRLEIDQKNKPQIKLKKCLQCIELNQAIDKLAHQHQLDLKLAQDQVLHLQHIIQQIQSSLNLEGDLGQLPSLIDQAFHSLKVELNNAKRSKKQLQLDDSAKAQASYYNTKRSEQDYEFAKIPQPPKTTTSRHVKKKQSLGGNSRVSVISNETPENIHHQNPVLQIQGQHIQFSNNRNTPSQLQHHQLSGTTGKKDLQDFIQKPKLSTKEIGYKTGKLQQAQIKLQDYISSERLGENSSSLQIKHNKAGLITDINGIQISAQDHLNYNKKSNTVRNPQNGINLKKSNRQYEHQYEANTFSNCSVQYPVNDSQIQDLNQFLENTKLSLENSQNSQNKSKKKINQNKGNKSKSQRVTRKKPLKQDESIIIQNLQLLQRQILRNQSNTSRGAQTYQVLQNSYQSQCSNKSPSPDTAIPIVKSKNGKMNNTITIQQKQKQIQQ